MIKDTEETQVINIDNTIRERKLRQYQEAVEESRWADEDDSLGN